MLPRLTRQGSRHVLRLFLTVPLSSAISLCSLFLTRGALARRRSVEAGTVLWCSLASCIDRRPWRGAGRGLGPRPPAWPPWASAKPVAPVRLKKPCAKRHSGSCLHHHTASRAAQRATLDCLKLRAHQPWAHRCWLCDINLPTVSPGRSAAQIRDRWRRLALFTSPRWGEVERSEGEGVQVSPDRALTPHRDLTVRPLPLGEVRLRYIRHTIPDRLAPSGMTPSHSG